MIVSFVSPASGRPSCFFAKGSGAGERYTGDDKGKPIERWGRKATGPCGLSRSLGRRADEERNLRRGVDFTGAPRLRFRLAQILASSGDLEEAKAVLDAFTKEHLRSLLPGHAPLGIVPVEN